MWFICRADEFDAWGYRDLAVHAIYRRRYSDAMKNILKTLKYYFAEKRYTQYDSTLLKRFFRKSFVILAFIYVPLATLATVSNDFLITDKKYAAIMLSGYAFSDYDYWASPLAFLGSYPAWTLYFNLKGYRADYFFNATKQDLKDVLIDSKYQSIVLVGHGSKNAWRATDDLVSNLEIVSWQPLFTKKTGEWIQLSCPTTDAFPEHIGELVMDNKSKVYFYNGEKAGNLEFVTDALTGFQLIKYESQKRRKDRLKDIDKSI